MSSSGKGQAGLVLGKRLTNAGHAVHGVTATDEFHVPSRTAAIANETLQVLGLDPGVTEDEIVNDMPGSSAPATASRARHRWRQQGCSRGARA